MAMRLVLIGPPGVGKGTQAALLKERLGLKPLSSGDIFRAEIGGQTELGKLAKGYIEKGQLVPDEVTIGMMAAHIKTDEVQKCGFILDGFPRTVPQAEALDKLLAEIGQPLSSVVCLDVDDEVVVGRLSGRMGCSKCGEIYHKANKPPKVEGKCDKCGGELTIRKDDQPETIRERLGVYHETTEPVIGYYETHGALLRVNGAGEAESVYKEIVSRLQ